MAPRMTFDTFSPDLPRLAFESQKDYWERKVVTGYLVYCILASSDAMMSESL